MLNKAFDPSNRPFIQPVQMHNSSHQVSMDHHRGQSHHSTLTGDSNHHGLSGYSSHYTSSSGTTVKVEDDGHYHVSLFLFYHLGTTEVTQYVFPTAYVNVPLKFDVPYVHFEHWQSQRQRHGLAR